MRQLTPEQQAVVDAYTTGNPLVVQAGAGTGKTTTIEAASRAAPSRRALYVAYNKTTAVDAEKRFPRNVECRTSHSLAFRAVGRWYKDRLNQRKRVPMDRVAKTLGTRPLDLDGSTVDAVYTAYLAVATVIQYTYSADEHIGRRHVPGTFMAITTKARKHLADHVLPYAQLAWQELQEPIGTLEFQHDHYMKMWQLQKPTLPHDVIMLDEAQDANPALADIINQQHNTQTVLVGDQQQAINTWRGAIDAMDGFNGTELFLSQSFRFGQHIADIANEWLAMLDAQLRLRGMDTLDSRIIPDVPYTPDAVLCRTNAGAIKRLMQYHDQDIPVSLVGAGPEARKLACAKLAWDADKRPSDHPFNAPEYALFGSWEHLLSHVSRSSEASSDLAALVGIIRQYEAENVIEAVDRAVGETKAQVTVSTTHRSKGREWDTVEVDDDFMRIVPDNCDGDPARADEWMPTAENLRLCYVAATRAKQVLDPGPLPYLLDMIRVGKQAQQDTQLLEREPS